MMIKRLWLLLCGLMLGQRCWKWWQVWRFFRQPTPQSQREPATTLVSLLQPILSGDPHLATCLRANLDAPSSYAREWLWLIDDNDVVAQQLCHELQAEYANQTIRIISLPAPAERVNPKTFKLIAGLAQAQGQIICVLDDDTSLPAYGLEACLPWLDQAGVGLAFGLPYYRSFDNAWSSLVALFVNSNSLLTYVPYIQVSEPFTINGMFYALRRDVLEQLNGFNGLEHILADDFAVAQRVKQAGLGLQQTCMRHAIRTTVTNAQRYRSLIQRWFIFPRESLLRHLNRRERSLLFCLVIVPTLFPLLLAVVTVLRPSQRQRWFSAIYTLLGLLNFIQIDQHYLEQSTPRRYWLLVPFLELLIPVQLIQALLAPQRIVWRGHVMDVEKGGAFRFVQRRNEQ
ncbi:glycosyltransferase family 2 protein [Herpetosiphon giganteus]|uniref:glycosyltransferase family 2 protein n=1 Tax=Herpetosiphon giganteus TaxID=2029754 RepID=UPI00195BD584|nr:glycosyltransferase [Herpetosiphon giganteus]MBM7844696.1 ceramide glucosyltransferase [Herpetosiphon giganteus]